MPGRSSCERALSGLRVSTRTLVDPLAAKRRAIARPMKPEPPARATVFASIVRFQLDVLSMRTMSDGAQRATAAYALQRMEFRGRFFRRSRIDKRSQREARYFGRAVDADSQPERAQAAIGVDIKIFVTVQARVEFLADAQNRFERRSIERNPHDAAVGVPGEHHARPQMTRVKSGVGIVREDDRAVVAVDVGERARRLGAPRPQIVDTDHNQFFVAQNEPAA